MRRLNIEKYKKHRGRPRRQAAGLRTPQLQWNLSWLYSNNRYPMQRIATCLRQGSPKGMWRRDMNVTGQNTPFFTRSSNNTILTFCRKWKHRTGHYQAMYRMSSRLSSNVVVWKMVFCVFAVRTVSTNTWSHSVAKKEAFTPGFLPSALRACLRQFKLLQAI